MSTAAGGVERPERLAVRSAAVARIRPLESGDLPQVTAIESMSFFQTWSERTFRNLLHSPEACLLAALEGHGRVIGYAAVWFAGREGELGALAVEPPFRRRGIGSRLVEAIVSESRGRGTRRLRLQVREGNRGAQSLYLGLGFDIIGRYHSYYDDPAEDALVMSRSLIP